MHYKCNISSNLSYDLNKNYNHKFSVSLKLFYVHTLPSYKQQLLCVGHVITATAITYGRGLSSQEVHFTV